MTSGDGRRPIDVRAGGLMVLLCLIWALQQVVLKATIDEASPLFQITLRSGIAALLVCGVVLFRPWESLFTRNTWKAGLLVGLLFALEFLFAGEALRFTSASHLVVFLYTAPVFAALGLQWLVPSERMNRIQWGGIFLAFVGIVLAFSVDEGDTSGGGFRYRALIGDGLAVLSAAAWGATTVAIRASALSSAPANQTLFYQLAVGFLILAPVTVALGQTHFSGSAVAWGSLAFQSVFVAFGSLLVWFWLLKRYYASRLGVLSFLTPVFGVVLSVWLLGEPLHILFVIGSLIVLAGVFFVSVSDLTVHRAHRARQTGLHRSLRNARAQRS